MMQSRKNFLNAGKPIILGILLVIAVQGMLTGCATTAGKKSSGITASREATAIWHAYEILPNYHYYYSGPDTQPNYLIGIDDRYKLMTEFWKPVDLTPEILKNWFNYFRPRVGYSQDPYGAFIRDSKGERIGLWYSIRDWRLTGTATVTEDNHVFVTRPAKPAARKKGKSCF